MKHRKTSRQNNPDSGGSVWTSLSDLFTSLAVVFLIMFVVVFLKHSLAKIKTLDVAKKFEEFVEGRLPDEQIAKADKARKQLNHSITQLQTMRQEMIERTQEINRFVTEIDQHQQIMDQLKRDQQFKQAAIVAMQEKVNQSQNALKEAEEKIVEKQKFIADHQQALTKKNNKITQLDNKILSLKRSIDDANNDIKNLNIVVKSKDAKLSENNEKMHNLEKIVANLKTKLQTKNGEIGRLKGKSYHKKLRQQIANKMASRFQGLGIDVELDRKTGKIYLRSDEEYLFDNDSFALENDVKLKLKQIIPIYAEELLVDPHIRQLITEINIVGHASPRYKGLPVDPISANAESFRFNMYLSVLRANAVSRYVFSNSFGYFVRKEDFRSLVAVSGMGFSKPILKEQKDDSDQAEQRPCGKFDCSLSRRVEIGFRLREDISDQKAIFAH